jgi:hypothetical protein
MVFSITFNNISVLLMQSAPITTNAVSSNPAQERCTDTTLCEKVCQCLAAGQWFSPGTPVSSANKTEILLKVMLNTITINFYPYK